MLIPYVSLSINLFSNRVLTPDCAPIYPGRAKHRLRIMNSQSRWDVGCVELCSTMDIRALTQEGSARILARSSQLFCSGRSPCSCSRPSGRPQRRPPYRTEESSSDPYPSSVPRTTTNSPPVSAITSNCAWLPRIPSIQRSNCATQTASSSTRAQTAVYLAWNTRLGRVRGFRVGRLYASGCLESPQKFGRLRSSSHPHPRSRGERLSD